MRVLLVVTILAHPTAVAVGQDQPESSARFQELLTAYNSAGGAFRATETDRQRLEAAGLWKLIRGRMTRLDYSGSPGQNTRAARTNLARRGTLLDDGVTERINVS